MDPDRERAARLCGVVLASTLLLTVAFVGVLALVSGGNDGVAGRLPVYVLAMAVAFVGAVVAIEGGLGQRSRVAGGRVVLTAGAVALAVLVAVGLSGEGVVYALRNPDGVVASEVFLYFLAAGLIGTGLGYWGLHHWREFAERTAAAPSGRL